MYVCDCMCVCGSEATTAALLPCLLHCPSATILSLPLPHTLITSVTHHCPCCTCVCCPPRLPPSPSLQGKIKGSYTASKMFEFSVRGTLSNAQLVLGIDKDLPYTARQVGATNWARL